MSQSSAHTPGVVGRGVVVVVVVVVLVVVLVVELLLVELLVVVTVLFISSSFSRGMGVVEDVGQPVNSVVALQKVPVTLCRTTVGRRCEYQHYVIKYSSEWLHNTARTI
jgi:hypothetical protein